MDSQFYYLKTELIFCTLTSIQLSLLKNINFSRHIDFTYQTMADHVSNKTCCQVKNKKNHSATARVMENFSHIPVIG
jgi:hypothetical protein